MKRFPARCHAYCTTLGTVSLSVDFPLTLALLKSVQMLRYRVYCQQDEFAPLTTSIMRAYGKAQSENTLVVNMIMRCFERTLMFYSPLSSF